MKNFSESKIYMITCLITNKKYIGATTMIDISTRLLQHIYVFRSYQNGKKAIYCTSFEIIKNNNFKIELLEYCPCNSQDELDAKERFYIQSIDCINRNIPLRTMKEYYLDKKDNFKNYYQRIKDNDRFKKKYECSCCGAYYTLNNKTHHMKTNKHRIKILSNEYNINVISSSSSSPQPASQQAIRHD
jgi:hypothetical protein